MKFEVFEKPNDWTKEVKKSESANETQKDTTIGWRSRITLFKIYSLQRILIAGSRLWIIG